MRGLLTVQTKTLARGFATLAVMTFCLITLGAMVRAQNAGLACPDWPLCFGEFIPQFNVLIAYEWGHRLLAGAVSLGLLALSTLALCRSELRAKMKPRLGLAWAILLTQIVFGGLTVLLKLAPWTVSVHLILGNTFCVCLLWIACDLRSLYGEARAERQPVSRFIQVLTGACVAFLFLQLLLGGLVSSNYAGLACSSFPTCDGESIVPELTGLIGLHLIHRFNGLAVLSSFVVLAIATRKNHQLSPLVRAGMHLVIFQIVLGAANVILELPFGLTALHTACAAAIVLTTALIAREVLVTRMPQMETVETTPARMVEAN